jgi:hypothetical protein
MRDVESDILNLVEDKWRRKHVIRELRLSENYSSSDLLGLSFELDLQLSEAEVTSFLAEVSDLYSLESGVLVYGDSYTIKDLIDKINEKLSSYH